MILLVTLRSSPGPGNRPVGAGGGAGAYHQGAAAGRKGPEAGEMVGPGRLHPLITAGNSRWLDYWLLCAALRGPVTAPSVLAVAPELTTTAQLVAGRNNTSRPGMGAWVWWGCPRNIRGSATFRSAAASSSPRGTSMPAPKWRCWARGYRNSYRFRVCHIEPTAVFWGGLTPHSLRDPVGQSVKINGRQFQVVGLLESKPGAR